MQEKQVLVVPEQVAQGEMHMSQLLVLLFASVPSGHVAVQVLALR
jgi:uncharacterized membrane protein YciS (DUF1049 family)